MGSDETFEAISHPLRIKILKLLAEKPMSFSELKRELGITSSGKLDFHMKKLGNLVTMNGEGKYTLTREGYAALQAIATVRRYGWQKRAFILATTTYVIAMAYSLWVIAQSPAKPIYKIIVPVLITSWYAFYSYWSIMKRKVFRTY